MYPNFRDSLRFTVLLIIVYSHICLLNLYLSDIINSKTLSICKKGVFIINIARGGIINEEDLLNSLSSGHCAGAALDVFVEEPPKSKTTINLIKHPNVIATPHIGIYFLEISKSQ